MGGVTNITENGQRQKVRPSRQLYALICSPSHVVSCLSRDKVLLSPLYNRYNYFNNKLLTSNCMYTYDVHGHFGCVNALTFSHSQNEYLASGKCRLY